MRHISRNLQALCLWTFALLPVVLDGQFRVSGQIALSADWHREIYLSALPTFEDLHVASADFVISRTPIDSNGYFEISGPHLPETDALYRLHVRKRPDPVGSLFIGGAEENFYPLILNNRSNVRLWAETGSILFRRIHLENSPINTELSTLRALIKGEYDPTTHHRSPTRVQMDRAWIERQIRAFIDTCAYDFVRLYGLHLLDLRSDYQEHAEFYDGLAARMDTHQGQSAYFRQFKNELDFARFVQRGNGSSRWRWMGFAVALIGALIAAIAAHRFRNRSHQQSLQEKAAQLSVQERRVWQLLRDGKSNKEISEALHIELSTVKSHTTRIYAKLGVKSRKEIARVDLTID